MRLTIGHLDSIEDTLWQREAITARWDGDRSDFVIRGDAEGNEFNGIFTGKGGEHDLAFQIEDMGPARLVWRGYTSSADVCLLESENVECCLTMFLDSWVGIVPLFSES